MKMTCILVSATVVIECQLIRSEQNKYIQYILMDSSHGLAIIIVIKIIIIIKFIGFAVFFGLHGY